jgi:hypothetical protein
MKLKVSFNYNQNQIIISINFIDIQSLSTEIKLLQGLPENVLQKESLKEKRVMKKLMLNFKI